MQASSLPGWMMERGPTRAPVLEELTITVWHDSAASLADLHDVFVEEVNAAVAEGRDDLVRDLADDYFERSVRVMIGQQPPGCARDDCVGCATVPRVGPPVAPHHRWLRRLRHPGGGSR